MVNRPEWSSVGTKERVRADQDARRPRSHTSISGFEGAQEWLKKRVAIEKDWVGGSQRMRKTEKTMDQSGQPDEQRIQYAPVARRDFQ